MTPTRGPADDPLTGQTNLPPPNLTSLADQAKNLADRASNFQANIISDIQAKTGDLALRCQQWQDCRVNDIAVGVSSITDGVTRIQGRIIGQLVLRIQTLANRLKNWQESVKNGGISVIPQSSQDGSFQSDASRRSAAYDKLGAPPDAGDGGSLGAQQSGSDSTSGGGNTLASSTDAVATGQQAQTAIDSTLSQLQSMVQPDTSGQSVRVIGGAILPVDSIDTGGGPTGHQFNLNGCPLSVWLDPLTWRRGANDFDTHYGNGLWWTTSEGCGGVKLYTGCDQTTGKHYHAIQGGYTGDYVDGGIVMSDYGSAPTLGGVALPIPWPDEVPCPNSTTGTGGSDCPTCGTTPCSCVQSVKVDNTVTVKDAPEEKINIPQEADGDADDAEVGAAGSAGGFDTKTQCDKLYILRDLYSAYGKQVVDFLEIGPSCVEPTAAKIGNAARLFCGRCVPTADWTNVVVTGTIDGNALSNAALDHCRGTMAFCGPGTADKLFNLSALLAVLESLRESKVDAKTATDRKYTEYVAVDGSASLSLEPKIFGVGGGIGGTTTAGRSMNKDINAAISTSLTIPLWIVPEINLLKYLITATIHWKPSSPADAVCAYFQEMITLAQLQCYVELDGKDWDDFRRTMTAQRAQPNVEQIIRLWRRGQIHPEDRDRRIKWNGWQNAGEIAERVALSDELPTPHDVVRMMVRDTDDPAIVIAEKLDQDFGNKFGAQLKQWAFAAGYDEKVMSYFWRAHFRAPGPYQVYRCLHRLRPEKGVGPNGGEPVTPADVERILDYDDLLPNWRKRLVEISYNVPTRVDTRRMQQRGMVTRDGAVSLLQDAGYDKATATQLSQLDTQLLSLPQLREMYFRGISTLDSALDTVRKHGYDQAGVDAVRKLWRVEKVEWVEKRPDAKAYVCGAAEWTPGAFGQNPYNLDAEQLALLKSRERDRRECKRITRCASAYHKRFMVGDISRPDFVSALTGLGMDAAFALQEVAASACELASKFKSLSAQQLCRLEYDGVLTPAELEVRMVLLGYPPQDAARVAGQCVAANKSKKETQTAAKQMRAAKQQQAQAAQAAKQAAHAIKEKARDDALWARRSKKLRKAAEQLAEFLGGTVQGWTDTVARSMDSLISEHGGSYEVAETVLLDAVSDIVSKLFGSWNGALEARNKEQYTLDPVVERDS